jgi:hypothetical protein
MCQWPETRRGFFAQSSIMAGTLTSAVRLACETNHLAQRAPERGSLRRAAAVDYYLNFVPHSSCTATPAAPTVAVLSRWASPLLLKLCE